MLKVIDSSDLKGNGNIRVLYPGIGFSQSDTGIGSIGRIDYATIPGNHMIPMHPHKNDEILSYFRVGECEHKDSEGFKEMISRKRLMLMKAGHLYYHEERMMDSLIGLQIFIRPGKENLKPEVIFLDLEQEDSFNNWRLIASTNVHSKLQFSSQTWIFDTTLNQDKTLNIPEIGKDGLTFLLYVFNGEVKINKKIVLGTKSSIIIKDEEINISTDSLAELVLFATDESAEVFREGMYSGNVY